MTKVGYNLRKYCESFGIARTIAIIPMGESAGLPDARFVLEVETSKDITHPRPVDAVPVGSNEGFGGKIRKAVPILFRVSTAFMLQLLYFAEVTR